jgi:DNA-binding transcriptional ArsR family regulator
VTPKVAAKVRHLRKLAKSRGVVGMAGATMWSVYMKGLAALGKHGTDHERGVVLSLDFRTWAQMAGTSAATVSRHVKRSPLLQKLPHRAGDGCSRVLFVVPETKGAYLQHSTTTGGSALDPTVAGKHLLDTLQRMRWGPGRVGKSRAAVLARLVDCGPAGKMHRTDLAESLGKKPQSLTRQLKWLVDAGLVVRLSHGVYALHPQFSEHLEEWRGTGREPEADRLQIAAHARQREAYRVRRGRPVASGEAEDHRCDGPTEAGIQNILRSRKKRWEYQQNPPPEPEKQTYEERKRRRLVREGMAERFVREPINHRPSREGVG